MQSRTNTQDTVGEASYTTAIDESDPKARRQTDRIIRYWESLRGDRELPMEDELDLDAIGDILENCFLIQLRDIYEESHYNYTFIGEKIITAYDSGRLNGVIPGLVTTEASHLSAEYHGVIALRHPMFSSGKHRMGPNELVKYRQCLLPLANAEGKITAILGQMGYKIYEE